MFNAIMGLIQKYKSFCDGQNFSDTFTCPEFPVDRFDTFNEVLE